jgi:hypothetical protein
MSQVSQARTYTVSDPADLAAQVKAAGGPAIDATQPTGQASADGVTIGWSIKDGITPGWGGCIDQITITIIRKPWIVPYSAIWSHVDSVLG